MIVANNDNFYLTDEATRDSPSAREGVDEETAFQLAVYGCELVQEGAILLKATQAVACTGQVLLHRFYAKKSMTKFDVKRVAATSVFLACKLEENPRKLRDVINVFHRMSRRREGKPLDHLEYFSQRYEDVRQDLIRTERHMLREFGFCIHVEHPHKFVLNYLRMMEQPNELMQRAWSLANDSLRTTLCVRFKADAVAVACIFLAARTLGLALPEDPPWYQLFDVALEDIEVMCESILALYEMLPPGSGRKAEYVSLLPDNNKPNNNNNGRFGGTGGGGSAAAAAAVNPGGGGGSNGGGAAAAAAGSAATVGGGGGGGVTTTATVTGTGRATALPTTTTLPMTTSAAAAAAVVPPATQRQSSGGGDGGGGPASGGGGGAGAGRGEQQQGRGDRRGGRSRSRSPSRDKRGRGGNRGGGGGGGDRGGGRRDRRERSRSRERDNRGGGDRRRSRDRDNRDRGGGRKERDRSRDRDRRR